MEWLYALSRIRLDAWHVQAILAEDDDEHDPLRFMLDDAISGNPEAEARCARWS